MIEPRLYRAAFLPALLAAVIAAFSLESPPRPAPPGLAADVLFDGRAASATVNGILQDAPDRRTGSRGDARTALRTANAFRRYGFSTSVDSFHDEGARLLNVVGRRPGLSEHELVVLASRDALSVPDATGSAADTAALIEVARALSGRVAHRAVVLVSVDGGARGDVGARRFADAETAAGRQVDAAIVLSNTGAAHSHGPLVIDWSNDSTRGSLGLRRTASDALRAELGTDGGGAASAPAQLARLAVPVGDGAQGVLLADGLPAVRISGSGELAPPPDRRGNRDFNPNRYGPIGRAVLRMVSGLDRSPAPPSPGPSGYIAFAGLVMPGWAISLLGATLILPALVASVDALARTRRRHHPIRGWVNWLARGALPFGFGLALAELLVLVGLAKDAPPAPLDPSATPVDGAAAGAMAAVAAGVLVAWIALRTSLLRRSRSALDPRAPGAAIVVALALAAATVLTWALNPYAGLLLVLPLHCWMLAVLLDIRPRARLWLVAIGLLPSIGVLLTYMHELSLGPIDAAWYEFLLVTGGQAGVIGALLGCILLGILASVVSIVVAHARRSEGEAAAPSVSRPARAAGPRRTSGAAT